MNKELTRYTSSYAKVRNSLAISFILFNSLFLFPSIARAENGLKAEVYNVLGQNNAPVLPANAQPILVTQVPNVDFDWGGGQILDSGRYEDVIVKLTGNFTPISTGTTYITAPADDGVRLYLDGQLYINDWYDKGGGGSTADVPTTQAVPMVIEMWYYENGGGANVKLLWFTDNGWEVIPSSAFLEPLPVSPIPEPVVPEEPVPVEPVQPEPEPLPEPEPEPVPVLPEPEVIPVPEPAPVPQPVPVPQPELPPAVEPEPIEPEPPLPPEPEPEPEPQPAEPEVPEEAPIVEPQPEPELSPEPAPEPQEHEESVTLDNGVVLTQEQAVAVALLQNPAELLATMFTDPSAALAAFAQVGADMSPEVREKSEKVVVSAIIAGGIATQAAAGAAATAAYRRKP